MLFKFAEALWNVFKSKQLLDFKKSSIWFSLNDFVWINFWNWAHGPQ